LTAVITVPSAVSGPDGAEARVSPLDAHGGDRPDLLLHPRRSRRQAHPW